MKLVRFGEKGAEKPGILLDDNTIADLSSEFKNYDEEFFKNGGMKKLEKLISGGKQTKYPELKVKAVRIGSPVDRPSKIVCVGLNFSDHAKELNMAYPEEPVLFMKASSSITGPYDDIEIPVSSKKTDWEVELGFVISKVAKNIKKKDAYKYIAGFMLVNDISEREFQMEHNGQWVKGKSHDTFAPMGPFLATKDEIGDLQKLDMRLDVNGKRKQAGTTANMLFDIPFLVSYISRFMTLLPGDVVITGTPAGVGVGMKPQQFLKKGDTIKFAIEGLGTQKHTMV